MPDVREFTLGLNNRITTSDDFKLTLQLGTGLFKGSFTEPGTKKPRSMSGALLQERALGAGLFLDGVETGSRLARCWWRSGSGSDIAGINGFF